MKAISNYVRQEWSAWALTLVVLIACSLAYSLANNAPV
jgi:hypothetical protein